MTTFFSEPKRKRFPIEPRSPRLAALMQSCVFILAANWCLQGMRGMDMKELSFRLGLELLLAGAILLPLVRVLPPEPAVAAAFLLAHTASFTLNGQVWVCARYCRCYHRDAVALDGFVAATIQELRSRPWLREAACIGSLARAGAIRGDRADIDLRLVFPPGATAWLRTNLLLLRLRSRAFLARIPLDLYAYAAPERLRRFAASEPLLVLLDRDHRLARLYPRRVRAWR